VVSVRREGLKRLRPLPVQAFTQAVIELHAQARGGGYGCRRLPCPPQRAAEQRLQPRTLQLARRGRRLILA